MADAPHPDWVAVHGPDAVPCEACDGGGTGEPGAGMADPCDVCGGTGEKPPDRTSGPGWPE